MPDQLDFLSGPTIPIGDKDPEWRELPPRDCGKRYRFRVRPDRLSGWEDRIDPHHPNLWYRPPHDALQIEMLKDGVWVQVRYYDTVWGLWQEIRKIPGVLP